MGWCETPSSASDICAQNGGDAAVGDPIQSCPLQDANIVEIKWVDGEVDGASVTVDKVTQWVNLPAEDKWVNNDEIKNRDRLGLRPKLFVKFDKAGSHSFKVKFKRPGGTVAYSADEKNRNGDFQYTETEVSLTTDSDGTKVFNNLKLVAGGGYEFIAEAMDTKGNKVTSGKLTTKRLVYYAEAKMMGLTSILGSTVDVENEYNNHHIKLKKLSDLGIHHQENIGTRSDTSSMTSNINSAINGSNDHKTKNQHMLIVAYTDHLAVKNAGVSIKSLTGVKVGPAERKVTLPITAAGLLPPHTIKPRYLWHDIIAGETWFVEAKYHKDGGGIIDIPASRCTHKGVGNYWHEVEVDVTGLPVGTGQVRMKVNVVDRMRAGLALGGANQTCVCTKAWWRSITDNSQKGTIIHELGHKLQMVTDGAGNKPDKTNSHYKGKGHAGDHCHMGCSAGQSMYNNRTNSASATCVMFGTSNGKLAFCADCAPALKKVDLTAGYG